MSRESTQKRGVTGKGRESKGYLFSIHLNDVLWIGLSYEDFQKLVKATKSTRLERATVYPLCFNHHLDRMVFEVTYPRTSEYVAEAYNIYLTALKLGLHNYNDDL